MPDLAVVGTVPGIHDGTVLRVGYSNLKARSTGSARGCSCSR